MTATGRPDMALSGAAGEHLVLSRLLSRGFLAAQAPRGVRKADILVNFLDGGEPLLIQVKARSARNSAGGWHMKIKHESIRDADVFYCFVDFEPVHPTVHVIPAPVVADVVANDHADWLNAPGRNGRPRNDTDMRRVNPNSRLLGPAWMEPYLENWSLLLRPARPE